MNQNQRNFLIELHKLLQKFFDPDCEEEK